MGSARVPDLARRAGEQPRHRRSRGARARSDHAGCGAAAAARAGERLPQTTPASPGAQHCRRYGMTTLGVSAALVDGDLLAGDVRIEGDQVVEVGLPPAAGGRIAAPGLVDLQVNGFAGVDLMAADVEEMRALAQALPRHGVTAFLPTLITAAAADTDRALDRLGE